MLLKRTREIFRKSAASVVELHARLYRLKWDETGEAPGWFTLENPSGKKTFHILQRKNEKMKCNAGWVCRAKKKKIWDVSSG